MKHAKMIEDRRARALCAHELGQVMGGEGTPIPALRPKEGTPLPSLIGGLGGTPLPA